MKLNGTVLAVEFKTLASEVEQYCNADESGTTRHGHMAIGVRRYRFRVGDAHQACQRNFNLSAIDGRCSNHTGSFTMVQ